MYNYKLCCSHRVFLEIRNSVENLLYLTFRVSHPVENLLYLTLRGRHPVENLLYLTLRVRHPVEKLRILENLVVRFQQTLADAFPL